MKLFTGFTRIASPPSWANISEHDGAKGYWTEFAGKHKVFLDKSNRVHLPKTLRGKSVSELRPEDFDMLDKSDSGDTHYKLWKEDFDKKKEGEKLFKNYKFTALGQLYIDRLKKYLLKLHMDDTSQLGLDPKFSIDFKLFDRILLTPQIDKVQSMLKSIARKYRIIITALEDSGKAKVAKKYDKDFYYNWQKVAVLVPDFDPASYKPKTEAKNRENDEEKKVEDDVVQKAKDVFLKDCEPLLDPQMGEAFKFLNDLSKSVDSNDLVQGEIDLEHLCALMMGFIQKFPDHPLGQNAEKILHLPSLVLLHKKLMGEN